MRGKCNRLQSSLIFFQALTRFSVTLWILKNLHISEEKTKNKQTKKQK